MAVRCEICKINFQDEYSHSGHLAGKKHLKNVELLSAIDRSIFITQIPHSAPLETVKKFFSQFGEIVSYKVGKNYLIIEYKFKETANSLLNKPIYLGGVRLKIKKRINNFERPTPEQRSKKSNDSADRTPGLDEIKSIFHPEHSFDEQLEKFINKLSVTEGAIHNIYDFTCSKLQEIFSISFPNCRVYRFGSTVTGIGFVNCDLDIYLDAGLNQNRKFVTDSSNNLASTIFEETKRILYSRSNLFSKICPIPKAKTPIIKFVYLPRNVSCDISFKNSLAVHNSQLIRFCLGLDGRFRPAIMIIKYWLIKNDEKMSCLISKYALSMLFLFYLQQDDVKLLPPLVDMKQTVSPQLVERWQVNINHNRIYLDDERNEISIPELLHGFFKFYAEYNYKENVICPLNGLSFSKLNFNKINNIPESMDRYKMYLKLTNNPKYLVVNKPLVIQDPFELNHNICGNVSEKQLDFFQKMCASAAEKCQNSFKENCTNLLISLFSKSNIEIKEKHSKTKQPILDIETIMNIRAYNFLKVGLPQNVTIPTGITENKFYEDNWFKLILNIVETFYEKILKLNVQLIISEEPDLKQRKLDKNSDVHSNDKLILHCTGNQCLWKNRKKIKVNLPDPNLNLLKKEIEISNILFNESIKNKSNDKKNLDINFNCKFIKSVIPDVKVTLVINNNGMDNGLYAEIVAYIKPKLVLIINKTLMHMQQFKKIDII